MIEKTLDYIKKHGTPLEVYRIEYLFQNKRDDRIPLKIFSEMQNADGGLPYNFEKGKNSSLSVTCTMLSVLSELNLLNYDMVKKLIKYLLERQKNDGRWSEDLEILEYDPPFWNMPGDLKCDMWLTAEMALKLLELGHTDKAEKAAHFLANHRGEDTFFGFDVTTVLAASLFSRLGKRDEIKNMEISLRDIVEKEEEPAFLNWYFEVLESSELEYKDPLMAVCVEKLQEKIRENVVFESVDGEQYNISNTIDSLKVLKIYGMPTHLSGTKRTMEK